jgi:hypothetical protein
MASADSKLSSGDEALMDKERIMEMVPTLTPNDDILLKKKIL